MIIYLYYPEIDFNYKVNIDKDEYLEYLYEKETNTPFNIMTYFLDKDKVKVYNKLEDKWFHNKLDLFEIRKEQEFYDFLINRFKDKAYGRYYDMEEKKRTEQELQLANIFNYVYDVSKREDYDPLTQEELEEIFLENFMGEV